MRKAGSVKSNKLAQISEVPDRKEILLAPEGTISATKNFLLLAYYLAHNIPEYNFVLRIHPALKYRKVKMRRKFFNLRISDESLFHDLTRSKYCVYRSSAVSIEAGLYGCIPVYFDTSPNNLDPLSIFKYARYRFHDKRDLLQFFFSSQIEDCSDSRFETECQNYFEDLDLAIFF